ncbi:hypothetical protein LBMAG42_27350 [Deltaproteobacteria bacterium]|nr:hypothetical protein LBMAG42_27350 [Deltaproteobacteria bacterium]
MLRWIAIAFLFLLVCGGGLTLASYAGFEWWRVNGAAPSEAEPPVAAAPGPTTPPAGGEPGAPAASEGASLAACDAGTAAFVAKDYGETIAQLDVCLEAHPNAVEAKLLRGRAYAAVERFDLAQIDLEKALVERPGDEPGWEALAYSRVRTENDRGAITALDAWIALNPSAARAWRMRADARFRLGNPTAALIDAERSCALGDADGCTLETRIKETRKRR